jgi:AGCS family alanine or glycine:cation symporter
MQLRGLSHMFRLMVQGRASPSGISSFQAMAMTLAGRVGTGNIAGVATAIAFGGPGAVFWMWVVAFLGASTACIESTLAQIYKEKDKDGQYRGGPAYYIEKGTGWRWYAWLFAGVTVIAAGLLLPGVQANSIAAGLRNAWGIPSWVTAALLSVPLGFIIIGGVKRIARFTQVVVPFMAAAYMLVAAAIMISHAEQLPGMFMLIVRSAFGLDASFGAMLGIAIQWGVKRGIYSNEAGQGSGAHAAAAAEVSHPAKQGYVQAFSVYIDTLLVCSATAFLILSTGMYNVTAPDQGWIVHALPGVEVGPGFAQHAVETTLPGWGKGFVALALLFFASTTVLAYYYMAETNLAYINRGSHRRWPLFALRLGVIGAVIYGTMKTAEAAWELGDIGVGLMAWFNIIAILILQRPALRALKDYETQRKAGRDPSFDPVSLGIARATVWPSRSDRNVDDRCDKPCAGQV